MTEVQLGDVAVTVPVRVQIHIESEAWLVMELLMNMVSVVNCLASSVTMEVTVSTSLASSVFVDVTMTVSTRVSSSTLVVVMVIAAGALRILSSVGLRGKRATAPKMIIMHRARDRYLSLMVIKANRVASESEEACTGGCSSAGEFCTT